MRNDDQELVAGEVAIIGCGSDLAQVIEKRLFGRDVGSADHQGVRRALDSEQIDLAKLGDCLVGQ